MWRVKVVQDLLSVDDNDERAQDVVVFTEETEEVTQEEAEPAYMVRDLLEVSREYFSLNRHKLAFILRHKDEFDLITKSEVEQMIKEYMQQPG